MRAQEPLGRQPLSRRRASGTVSHKRSRVSSEPGRVVTSDQAGVASRVIVVPLA